MTQQEWNQRTAELNKQLKAGMISLETYDKIMNNLYLELMKKSSRT